MVDQKAYTFRQALKDAHEMLEQEFGKAEQHAAVSLATVLYGAHERDQFLRENREESQMAYGGADLPGGRGPGSR